LDIAVICGRAIRYLRNTLSVPSDGFLGWRSNVQSVVNLTPIDLGRSSVLHQSRAHSGAPGRST
jgi:hypothetical protein